MVISIERLAEINNMMLGRGAPVKRDNFGYNKPDYAVCQSIYYGMSYAQAADVCNRLKKYVSTQLKDISILDLEESEEYYLKLAGYKPAVTIKYNNDYTALYFRYDPDIVSIIKTANNRKWDGNNKCWLVKNNEILVILNKLLQIADVENAIKYFTSKHITAETSLDEIKNSNIKISVTENGDYLNLKFNYNVNIINAVKACLERKYNSTDRTWIINKNEVLELIKRLEVIENIDYSELKKYIIEKTEIILKEMANISRKPFNHQLEAAKFLLEKKKAILADEMGGGKTTSAIIAAYNIKGKKLIICPASLKLNWKKEILLVDCTAKIGIINGKSITELIDCDWYIINYDILNKHLESILNTNFACVILDEAHYIKSINNSGKPTAERGKATLQITDKIKYVFCLTGTPITNKTKDIFNLLKAIEHPLSKKWMTFALRYCGAYRDRFGWDMNGSTNINELHERLKPVMLRRLKEELLDLPEKIRTFIPVEIDIKEYNKQFDEYMLQRKNITAGEQLVKLNALKHLLAIQKIKYTIEQIENLVEQNKSVVVFTCYDEVVKQIIEHFPEAGKITGECSISSRQKTVDAFQNNRIKIVVCNIIAAGVGITLTASDTVIFNDFDWTPANHLQAEDRIHRIGQSKKCNIIYMYAENASIDYKISRIIENKLQNINAVIDGNNESIFEELIKNL